MTPDERTALIRRYMNGYADVTNSLEGITQQELDFAADPGKWSCREIVHHLADSETTSGIRLRRLLAEDHPHIQGYDQDEFARRLHYRDRPIGPALMALQAAIESTSQLIERMDDSDWQRTGEHSEVGAYSAEKWLETYAVHASRHAEQIRRNRAVFRVSK
jgi:hypothetical protein